MAGSNLGTLLLNIVTRSDTTGLSRTDSALRRTQRNLQNTAKNMGFLAKLGKAFVGYIGLREIGNMAMGYVNFEKQLGAIHSRFYAITGDAKLANAEFDYARKISHETAMNLMDVADSYSIFYSSAARTLGSQGAKEVYENWTKVARVLHVSGEQYKSIMYAQREMSSKGRLYAQDLLIQMGTHVPDIKNIATTAIKALGIQGVDSIESFQAYTKTNKGSDIMGRFLLEMSREAKRRYATDEALRNALGQPDALVNRIEIAWQDFLIAFSKHGGQVLVVKTLEGILNVLGSIDYDAIATSLGTMAKNFANIFNFLTSHINTIITLLKIIAITYIGGRIGSALRNEYSAITKQLFTLLAAKSLAKSGISGGLMMAFLTRGSTSSVLGRIVSVSVFTGVKRLFGGVLVRLLGFLGGPWGIAVSLLITFMPQILGLIKAIWNKIPGRYEGGMMAWQERFGNMSGEQARNILLDIQRKGVLDQADLNRQLLHYQGGEKLLGAVTYNDNKHVTFNFDDNHSVRPEDIPPMWEQMSKDDKKNVAGNMFNKGTRTFQPNIAGI